MDKLVFTSKYANANYNEQTQIFTCTYLLETKNMLNHEWKELILSLVALQEKYKPRFIIDDNRDRLYDYEPERQTWTLEQCIKCWNRIKLKKYVQIIPQNIIGQIATEQIVELGIKDFFAKFEIKVVTDYSEAMEWISK